MMGKKVMKVGALIAVGGMAFQFGGCLSLDSFWGKMLWDGALNVGWQFLTDNDAIFDLFQDDYGTGTQFDDRFTPAPARDEPDGSAIANFTQP